MEEKILEILAEACEDDSVKEDMDMELFEADLLDSLGFAELLAELEEELGVVIDLPRWQERIWIRREKLLSL